MALNIKSDKADSLAREVARRCDLSITDAVITALEEKLERVKRKSKEPGYVQKLLEIGKRYSELPVLDNRSDDEILGYDEMLK